MCPYGQSCQWDDTAAYQLPLTARPGSCANQRFAGQLRQLIPFGWTQRSSRVNWLELTFQTAELREICEKRAVATTELGYDAARELEGRLADMEALETVADLCQLLGEAILDRSATEKCLRLRAGFNIVFTSAHPRRPGAESKATDWEKTTRMKITAIEAVNG